MEGVEGVLYHGLHWKWEPQLVDLCIETNVANKLTFLEKWRSISGKMERHSWRNGGRGVVWDGGGEQLIKALGSHHAVKLKTE